MVRKYTPDNTICAGFKSIKPLKLLFIEFLKQQEIKTP